MSKNSKSDERKMNQQGINVQLSVKDIYNAVCPDCKKKIKEMVKAQISDKMVNQVTGGE